MVKYIRTRPLLAEDFSEFSMESVARKARHHARCGFLRCLLWRVQADV